MRERGFILQPTYRIEAGRPVVHLYGKLESGRPFLVRDTRQVPHFYVREADEDRVRVLGVATHDEVQTTAAGGIRHDAAAGASAEPGDDRASRARSSKRTFAGEPVVRIEAELPGDVPPLRDRLLAHGIVCLEADVRFALRPLIERHVRGALEISGEPRDAGFALVFDDPVIAPADWTPRLSVLSFDIETDPTAKRLFSVSLWGCGAAEVLL